MKRLFNNTLFTSFDLLILVLLNLAATPILIAYFGIDGYGVFVFLSIFTIYGALSFFELGMEGSLMNYVARFEAAGNHKKLQDTLSVSILYYAFLGCLIGIILYLAGGLITGRLLDDNGAVSQSTVLASINYLSINIFLQFLTIPFTAILQGMRRFVVTKSLSSIMNVLRYLLITLAAIVYGRIDMAFLIILALTVVRLMVLLAIIVFKTPLFRRMRIRFDFALLRILLNYTSVLFISRIIGLIHNQIDKILIWFYLAVSSMAVYDVIARPAALLQLIMSVLNSAVIPEVARLHELKDMAAIRDLYIRLVRFAYLILLPLLAVFFVFIGDLLHLWVGPDLAQYAWLALILLSTYAVLPIPSVASTMVVGLEQVRQTIWIPVVATIMNIILSVILIHTIGLAGLLVATLAAELFATWPYLRAMQRMLEFGPGDIIRPVLSIALVALAAATLYLLIRYIFLEKYIALVISAAVIFCLNCLINYKYLLSDRERSFLRERLQAAKARMAM